MMRSSTSARRPLLASALFLGALAGLTACKSDNDPAPAPTTYSELPDPVVTEEDELPGIVVAITSLSGGTGTGGNFQVGDTITVHYTVTTDALDGLDVANLTRGQIFVSGPTSNYQRVIASQNLLTASTRIGETEWSYTFTSAIPANYLAPLNDTTALTVGELTGTALQSGTYTVGIELRKDYTVEDVVYRDPGNTTQNFLLGSATTLAPRELVTQANCNNCHSELRAHGNNRYDVNLCLLCHTAGAEDRNTSSVAGGTPGVTIDFKVMIHKIHSGSHLPSVNGVATNNDGTRNYAATAQPYEMIGFGDSLVDFSAVVFPAWPSFYTQMPRDVGYTSLTSGQQTLENTMRGAPVGCSKCHGDPDGSGPLAAPTDGDAIWDRPTRAVCGSCHDDWDPAKPYTSNYQTMDPQADDTQCTVCHDNSGLQANHTHPLVDSVESPGIHFDVTLSEVNGNSDGTFDAGEKIGVQLAIHNDNGDPIVGTTLTGIYAVLEGPTTNPNMLHYVRLGNAAFTGSGPYTFNLPAQYFLEPVGTSNGSLNTFTTAKAPHWNVTNATTTVYRVSATGSSTTLSAAAVANQNYIDVASASGISNGSYILLDTASPSIREFLRVQWVNGTRLWFGSEYRQDYPQRLQYAHSSGGTVQVVTLSTVSASNYTLTASSGTIAETTEFGAGEILVSYTSDYVIPSVYTGTLGESPDLDETCGDWLNLPLASGTYHLTVFGNRSFTHTEYGEATTYSEGAVPTVTSMLFGSATELEEVARISSGNNCYACHSDIQFHGGSRRGWDTCIACHGVAGAEDAPNYVYPTAQATTGCTVTFRTMLHKIHNGAELAAGANYVVVGNSGTPHTYNEVEYPVTPGGVRKCAVCHGTSNTAWVEPADRTHASQTYPTRSWRDACNSCHDSNAATAHIDSQTSASGYEACATCHTDGKIEPVRRAHIAR